jgi:hypothetical protein
MRLFKILTDETRPGRPMIVHFQTMQSVPPISCPIGPSFWRYNETMYIIDLDYNTACPVDPKDLYTIYRLQLEQRLLKFNFL